MQTYYVCSLHFSLNDIKISGKRKTVISGRFPTIFTSYQIHESNSLSQCEEECDLQQSNIDATGLDDALLSVIETISNSNDNDFQKSNDLCSIDVGGYMSEMENDYSNDLISPLDDDTEKISNSNESNNESNNVSE